MPEHTPSPAPDDTGAGTRPQDAREPRCACDPTGNLTPLPGCAAADGVAAAEAALGLPLLPGVRLAVEHALKAAASHIRTIERRGIAEAVLALHKPQPVYGRAFDGKGNPLCSHDPDAGDPAEHFLGDDDDEWYCETRVTGHVCGTCAEEDAPGQWCDWPCATYMAVTGRLPGEEVPSS